MATITTNLCVGVATWAASTAYAVGKRVVNSGKLYECTTAGTSAASGGPSVASGTATDGSVVWTYKAVAHYTTPSTWVASIVSPTADNYVAQFWRPDTANGEITVTGSWFNSGSGGWLGITGKTWTGGAYAMLCAAPGEGFADNGAVPLRYDATKGVAINDTNAGGYNNVIGMDGAGAVLKLRGLQIKSAASSTSTTAVVASGGAGLDVDACLFDKRANSSLDAAAVAAGRLAMRNCVVVDRGTAGDIGPVIQSNDPASYLANCTIVAVNLTPGTAAATHCAWKDGYWNVSAYNCAFFGYANPIVRQNTGTTVTLTNCATDAASFGAGTAPTACLVSVSAANTFVSLDSTTPDLRLKAGSPLIGAATTDTTHVPSGLDIFGTART